MRAGVGIPTLLGGAAACAMLLAAADAVMPPRKEQKTRTTSADGCGANRICPKLSPSAGSPGSLLADAPPTVLQRTGDSTLQLVDEERPANSDRCGSFDDMCSRACINDGNFLQFAVQRAGNLWRIAFSEEPPKGFELYTETCLAGYADVPYHHRGHALDVYQFFLKAFGHAQEKVNDGDRVDVRPDRCGDSNSSRVQPLALPQADKQTIALALLCHDYGHPGLNNAYAAHVLTNGLQSDATLDGVEREFTAIKDFWSGKTFKDKGHAGSYLRYSFVGELQADRLNDNCITGQQPEIKGCGAEKGSCASIEETFHASQAGTFFSNSLKRHGGLDGVTGEGIQEAIRHTDMGFDYKHKKDIYEYLTGENTLVSAVGILIHLADISGSAGEYSTCWSASVNAEFSHQAYLVGKGLMAENTQTLAKSEMSWEAGLEKYLDLAYSLFPPKKEHEKGHATRIFRGQTKERLSDNIAKLKTCEATKPVDFGFENRVKWIFEFGNAVDPQSLSWQNKDEHHKLKETILDAMQKCTQPHTFVAHAREVALLAGVGMDAALAGTLGR